MNNNILILEAGLYSSVQDLGRKGYRSSGVPISGTMDKYSAILANKLLNNEENLPVLEMTLIPPKILFEDETFITITGADMLPKVNEQLIQLNMVHKVSIGDVLSFGGLVYGSRAYLGVSGGFLTPFVLNSYSFYKGVTIKGRIEKGDRLKIAKINSDIENPISKIKVSKAHFQSEEIEVTKGPEFNRLSKDQRETLFSKSFEIDELNNRMGYQLKGNIIPLERDEIITSAVIPGTVQITPSGKIIILMRDCQTTGGYPRILQLTDIAINQLAQKTTNDVINFELESGFSYLSRLVSKFKN